MGGDVRSCTWRVRSSSAFHRRIGRAQERRRGANFACILLLAGPAGDTTPASTESFVRTGWREIPTEPLRAAKMLPRTGDYSYNNNNMYVGIRVRITGIVLS